MLQQTQLSPHRRRRFEKDLDRLPAMPRIADMIDGVERFCYLDSVGHMARDGVQELDQFAWLSAFPGEKSLLEIGDRRRGGRIG